MVHRWRRLWNATLAEDLPRIHTVLIRSKAHILLDPSTEITQRVDDDYDFVSNLSTSLATASNSDFESYWDGLLPKLTVGKFPFAYNVIYFFNVVIAQLVLV